MVASVAQLSLASLLIALLAAAWGEGETSDESLIVENWKSYREKRIKSESNLLQREYSSLDKLLDRSENDVQYAAGRARACELAIAIGRWTEAIEHAEILLELDPELGLKQQATRWRAKAMLRTSRKTDEAIESYYELAKARPRFAASPLFELAEFLIAQGRLEPVDSAYSLLETLKPEMSPYVEEKRSQLRRIGGSAPVIDCKGIDGEVFDQGLLDGKVIIVSFWALWNSESVNDLHDIADFSVSLREKVAFVAINLDGPDLRNSVKSYLAATGTPGLHLAAENGFASDVTLRFAVESLPGRWVLTADKKVAGIDLQFEATALLAERLIK